MEGRPSVVHFHYFGITDLSPDIGRRKIKEEQQLKNSGYLTSDERVNM